MGADRRRSSCADSMDCEGRTEVEPPSRESADVAALASPGLARERGRWRYFGHATCGARNRP